MSTATRVPAQPVLEIESETVKCHSDPAHIQPRRSRFWYVILEQLAAAAKMGLPTKILASGCRHAGIPEADEGATEAECSGYLKIEGFLTDEKGREMYSVDNRKRYRITAAGLEYLTAVELASSIADDRSRRSRRQKLLRGCRDGKG